VTLLHHAEHLAEVPNKGIVRYWAPILHNGEKAWIQIEEFNTGGEGCLPWHGATDLFEAIVRDYLRSGQGVVGLVGAAQSHLFDAAGLTEFAVGWIEERFADHEPEEFDVEIRAAEPSDHRELVVLLGMYDEELSGSSASPARLSTRVDEFLEDPDRKAFVAVGPEGIVGMIVTSRPAPDRGAIDLAFVEPAYRRRGILRELETDASAHLRGIGCHTVELRVDAGNGPARAAWRDLGYEPTVEFLERPL